MKVPRKILLSAGVVGLFIVYSIQQRNDTSGGVNLPTHTTSSENPALTPSSIAPTAPIVTPRYKDGTYVGDAADAFYGFIQVEAVIKNGTLSDVQFLQYPNDRQNSIEINSQAMPLLKQEAIQAQSSQVNIITGATDSSQAFIQSLASALSQAKPS